MSTSRPASPVVPSTSLSARFAALQAERERSWPPEQLARNAGQRRALVERAGSVAHPAPGARLAPFVLRDAAGVKVDGARIVADGPAVLLFFRFGGCPACNIALPYYNETLYPALAAAGIPLLAVSAQNPVDPGPTARHGLRFPTYADPGYALSRQLGLTFFPQDQPAVTPGEPWIGATLGTDSYEMGQPAVLVLEPGLRVRHLAVSPDWMDRPETETILARVLGPVRDEPVREARAQA